MRRCQRTMVQYYRVFMYVLQVLVMHGITYEVLLLSRPQNWLYWTLACVFIEIVFYSGFHYAAFIKRLSLNGFHYTASFLYGGSIRLRKLHKKIQNWRRLGLSHLFLLQALAQDIMSSFVLLTSFGGEA